MASISYNLKNLLIKENYQFIVFNRSGCPYIPGFDKIKILNGKVNKNCNKIYFDKIKKILSNENNSIIIFGGRLPLFLNKTRFNNREGGIILPDLPYDFKPYGNYLTIEESFKNEVLNLSKRNKIILIYPIPEVGWNVPQRLYTEWLKRKIFTKEQFILSEITTSHVVYKERSKSSFKLLDSIDNRNIYRIYPEEVFCNLDKYFNRCITQDENNLYYIDDNHLSVKGSEKLNEIILKKIKSINLIDQKKNIN